ncbi:unnamed protein product [Ectocarpus sp. 6 AP-2014]
MVPGRARYNIAKQTNLTMDCGFVEKMLNLKAANL